MAATDNFREGANQVFTLHSRGDYRAALDVVHETALRFPERSDVTTFWRACLLCRVGERDQALSTLRVGLARGLWWSPEVLRYDTDLAPIQDRTEFAALVADCQRRLDAARSAGAPGLRVIRPTRPDPADALLIALHWRLRDVEDFDAWWLPIVRHGVTLALPRSSQQLAMRGYGWDDAERAASEVADAYATLRASEAFDPTKIILAGASQGAAVALRLALADAIPAQGVIAVAPALENVEGLVQAVGSAARSGLRCWFVTGEFDEGRPATEFAQKQLANAGLPCHVLVVAGLGHDFPQDFETMLPVAIDFVLDRR